MPLYIYLNESTNEYREILQGMNDPHEYFGETDEVNEPWQRVFTIPNASIDTQIDPFNSNQFVDRTGSKKGSYGDMLDYSSEMSQRRADQAGGVDPVKEKYFKEYSKKRKGAKHFEQMKTFENKGIEVKY